MAFWKPTKTKRATSWSPDTGTAMPAKKKIHRSEHPEFGLR